MCCLESMTHQSRINQQMHTYKAVQQYNLCIFLSTCTFRSLPQYKYLRYNRNNIKYTIKFSKNVFYVTSVLLLVLML